MRSTTSGAQEIDQNLPTAQSIISKLTAPFAARKRNLAEYYIRAKEPHRQYSPGDRVEGSVVVTITKPIRITHIVVCLHGFVKVFSSAKSPGQNISHDRGLIGGGSGRRGYEYFGDGFASLFENEVALCGEGRLEAGSFEFQFDLELPSKGIPSSIDFERGAISYMVTSTMTRPTTISPTSTCDLRIHLLETVDIASLPQPKPRMVSVEALPRRSLTKISAKKVAISPTVENRPTSFSSGPETSVTFSEAFIPPNLDHPPISPVTSEISSVSAASSSTSSRRISLSHPPALTSNSLGGQNSAYPSPREVVTATIELLQGGCLPGDRVPLQIMINHNKPVKSLQGIIITLYREGHVDTHPAIPLGPLQPGKKKQYEDYYPRSRTGLGGLSLLSAGTSSGFRKDLNQKIVPLIIDPKTLNAVIKTSIQVPEDLFPTISAVPGAMVTFKYNIEVVIDLRGRLTGQDRFFPRLNMIGGASKYDYNDYTGIKPDGLDSLSFPSAVPLILLNTDNARREKGVVACVFEIIVGTRDSRRKRPRQVENHQGFAASSSETSRISEENRALESIQAPYNDRAIPNTETDPQSHTDAQCTDHGAYNERTMGDLLPQMTPLPDIDEGHDEKSRITRAERWLLPSAPSEIGTHLDSDRSIPEPSAPGAYYEENYGQLEGQVGIDAPIYSKLPASSWETVIPDGRYCDYENSLQAEPRVNSSMAGAEDDKQERERRRLQMAASSPDGYECGEINGPYDQRHTIEPTAPSLNENLHLHHALHGSQHISQPNHLKLGNENLPLYQK